MKRYYPAIDIARFILAILVVAIHVRPFTGNAAFFYDDCIARIADPLFFMISAYLFFTKVYAGGWKKGELGRYLRRLLKLYLAWLLIYSPVIIHHTLVANKEADLWQILGLLLRKILLEGPYGAMWFLTALLLAIPLTYVVTRYLGAGGAVLLSFPFYLFTVLQMEYTRLVHGIGWMDWLYDTCNVIFGWLANGLTYGFFFCALGMLAAKYKFQNDLQKHCPENTRTCFRYWMGFIISLVALFAEVILIRRYELGVSYGAMLCLIPVSCFLLQLLTEGSMPHRKIYGKLRNCSVLIFTIHYGIMELFGWLWKDVSWYIRSTTIQYFIVLAVTLIISAGIIRLSENNRLKFLKVLF